MAGLGRWWFVLRFDRMLAMERAFFERGSE
jgi:hypothetical protein